MSGALLQSGDDLAAVAHYVNSGASATGLTVTVDIWRKRGGSWSQVVTGQSCTEIGDGIYEYEYANANIDAGDLFVAVFDTAGTVDQRNLAARLDIEPNYTAAKAAFLDDAITDIPDLVWDETLSNHNTKNSAAQFLKVAGATIGEFEVNDGSPTATGFVTDLTESTDDFFNDQLLVFTSGDAEGISVVISDYDGTTKTLTFDEGSPVVPANGDTFAIVSRHTHSKGQIADAVLQEAVADHSGDSASLAGFVDAIKTKTDNITQSSVTVTSPVASDGTTITIYQGGDYTTGASWEIDWTGLDGTASLTGGTPKVILRNDRTGTVTTYTSEVSILTATSVRWQPTNTQTDALDPGFYTYFVEVALSVGDIVYPVTGVLKVVEVD